MHHSWQQYCRGARRWLVSYDELNRRANQLAHCLIERGVKPRELVGIYAYRGIEVLVAMLAVNKAGGAFVPLDPVNPVDRVRYMIEDSAINHLLADRPCLDTLDFEHQLQVFQLGGQSADEQSLGGYPEHNPNVETHGSDVAYMIYTSGSTGQPKGAMVHHGGAINHIEAEFERFGFADDSGQLSPVSFLQCAASSCDVSVWQFLAPLMCGGKTVVLDEITDVVSMVQLVQQHQIELVELAPVVLQLLVSHVLTLTPAARAMPDLKFIMTTGEPTPVSLVNQWLELYPQVHIMNCYGPTEASDDITWHITREPLPAGTRRVSIGKPLPNLAILILDEQLNLQPLGVPGEICVTGVGVGPGYWNKPDKTAAAFVDNPYCDEAAMPNYAGRLYRTGDLGYYDEQGNIELIGRKDAQIKIRGLRIELGEIESALAALAEVKQAVVLVKHNHRSEKVLCAWLVGDALSKKAMRQLLGRTLPEHMIPTTFTLLDKMPTNSADKIDKFALPEPDFEYSEDYVAPDGSTETTLVEIVAELLQRPVSGISVTSGFFELGGHSLLAVRLISQIEQQLKVKPPLVKIFELGELRALADYIDSEADNVQAQQLFEQLSHNADSDDEQLTI